MVERWPAGRLSYLEDGCIGLLESSALRIALVRLWACRKAQTAIRRRLRLGTQRGPRRGRAH